LVPCLNSLTSDEPKYKTNSLPRLPFLKPKLLIGSAFCPVVSKTASYDSGKRASICSQEVCRTMTELKHSLNDSIADQLLLESTKKGRPHSPIPDDKGQDFTSAEAPHEVKTLMPHNNNVRAISPNQLITFPPEMPSKYHTYSKPHTPEPKNKSIVMDGPVTTIAFETKSQSENISQYPNECSEHAELNYLPKFRGLKGPISIAMEVAPDRPFTPVALTEPIIKPTPWIPLPTENENRPESPLVAALQTAPERSYSPLPTFMYASELLSPPKVDPGNEVNKTVLNVQTQNINFGSSDIKNSTRPIGNNPVRYMHGYNNKRSEILLQINKELPQEIQNINSQKEPITGLGLKSSQFPSDNLSISGPYEPIESKSNYNETFITRVPNFEEHKQILPEYNFTTSNKNISLNHSPYQQNITKPTQLSASDNLSISNRSMGPGIKNKVSAFTSNSLISDTPFLNRSSNSHFKAVADIDNKSTSTVDSSFKYKSNHPSTVKLCKAIPFFSNNTSSNSAPAFTRTP